jgi:hypothetical protein
MLRHPFFVLNYLAEFWAHIRLGGHRFESCSRYSEPLLRNVLGFFCFLGTLWGTLFQKKLLNVLSSNPDLTSNNPIVSSMTSVRGRLSPGIAGIAVNSEGNQALL